MSNKDAITIEWDDAVNQINTYLEEAANALNKAGEIRKKAGINKLVIGENDFEDFETEEEYDDMSYKLEEAFDLSNLDVALFNAGWQSSSDLC